jgi:hypothetical protein
LFIKRTKRTLRGKTYTNHLLVESVATERGPRHRVICSLGSLGPAPKGQWLKLAHHLQDSLGGQESFLEHSAQEQALVQKATLAASELAMSEWAARSALSDILKEDFSQLNEDRLYRNMDRLYGKRGPIQAALCAKEKSLFSLQESILLYDLTSTYFEGLRRQLSTHQVVTVCPTVSSRQLSRWTQNSH